MKRFLRRTLYCLASATLATLALGVPTATPDLGLQLARGVLMAISALVFVALGSILLERSLRRAGVLEGFPG